MKKITLIAALLGSVVATPAFADAPAVTVTGTPGALANGPYTLGYAFSTSQTFSVSGLGLFDADSDGLASAHDVGIWDAAGNLLASTTVGAGASGSLVSGFRFSSVTPFNILAGTYRVGAVFLDGSDFNFFGGDGVLTPATGVTFLSGAYANGATLADPTTLAGGAPAYIGGNVLLGNPTAAVPEPATWGMMLLGFGAAGYAMRRRAKVRTNVSFA